MDHSVAPHVPTGLVRTDQRRVLVLGSTGSVGTQALDVIAANSGAFAVAGLAAGGADPATVAAQAVRFRVPLIALGRADAGPGCARLVAAITAERDALDVTPTIRCRPFSPVRTPSPRPLRPPAPTSC